jgi:hypothetical protein
MITFPLHATDQDILQVVRAWIELLAEERYEARCLCQTEKRMKMGRDWGILEGGAGETRSWRIGATSPITKLILVRYPDG